VTDGSEQKDDGVSGEDPTEPLGGLGQADDATEAMPPPEGSGDPTELLDPAAGAGQAGSVEHGAGKSSGRWMPPPGTGLLMLSIWAAIALTVAYIFAGGTDYKPRPVADPCDPREWSETETIEQTAQEFALSALDGAACELGVSREELTRALATRESLDRFARDNDFSSLEIESAIRSGAGRAIDDAQRADAISPLVAFGLKAAIRTLPLRDLIELIQDASTLIEGEGGLESILPPALDGLREGIEGEGGFDIGEALEGITGPDGLDLEGALEGLLGPDGPDLEKGLEGLFKGGGGGSGGVDQLLPPDSSVR
jgi:hypothetical protein